MRTLLSGYLRELVNLSAEYRPEDRADLLTVTIDLITALLTHEVEPEQPWDPDVQRARILDFMRRHLSNPNLDPAMIAAAHHMSTRTLHKLFQAQDLTVASWIRRRHRLENCRRDLTDPHLRAPDPSTPSPSAGDSPTTPTSAGCSVRPTAFPHRLPAFNHILDEPVTVWLARIGNTRAPAVNAAASILGAQLQVQGISWSTLEVHVVAYT